MGKDRTITPEQYQRLLQWLDPDEERAALAYLEIRRRIETFFAARRFQHAEDLTDIVFERVLQRVEDWAAQPDRKPIIFFFGVAKKVVLEQNNHPEQVELPLNLKAQIEEDKETLAVCLEKCLARLSVEKRAMVLAYYEDERRARIDHRRELAKKYGMSENALRLQVFRVRNELEIWLRKCMEQENL